jgi:hypothetical protein
VETSDNYKGRLRIRDKMTSRRTAPRAHTPPEASGWGDAARRQNAPAGFAQLVGIVRTHSSELGFSGRSAIFIAARGRVATRRTSPTTAEVLLRAANFLSAVDAVVSAIHSDLEAARENAGAHSGDLRNPTRT